LPKTTINLAYIQKHLNKLPFLEKFIRVLAKAHDILQRIVAILDNAINARHLK
jgi:cell fate (sporulation/competence/biofilm development) regulator YmcA (YheA/YmcA/DUF963 family)